MVWKITARWFFLLPVFLLFLSATDRIGNPLKRWTKSAMGDTLGAPNTPGEALDRAIQAMAGRLGNKAVRQVRFVQLVAADEPGAAESQTRAVETLCDEITNERIARGDAYVGGEVRSVGRFVEIRPWVVSSGLPCPTQLGRILIEGVRDAPHLE